MKKRITYHRVVAEGFQSLSLPTEFKLDRGSSITLIKGTNGMGKTTLFNAIWWAEYGDNMKTTVQTWDDVRPETFRGTRVIIERSIGDYDYMIARHQGFKGTTKGLAGGDSLMVFVKHHTEPNFDKTHLVDAKYKKDSQDLIEKQLGIKSKIFMNSIIFGQKMQKLIEADNKEKRELFEDLFELKFVEGAMESAKEKLQESSLELNATDQRIDLKDTRLVSIETSIADEELAESTWIVNRNERIKKLEDALEVLESGEVKINSELITKLTAELDLKSKELESLKADYDNYQKAKQELSTKEDETSLLKDKLKNATESRRTALDLKKAEKVKEFRTAELEKHELITAAKTKYQECRDSILDLERKIAKEQEDVSRRLKEISEVLTKCPSCLQAIKEEQVKNTKEALKKDNKASEKIIATLKVELEKAKTREEDLRISYDSEVADLTQIEEELELEISKDIEEYSELIDEKFDMVVTSLDKELETATETMETATKSFDKSKKAYETYEKVKDEKNIISRNKLAADEASKGLERLVTERKDTIEGIKKEEQPESKTIKLKAEKDEIIIEKAELEKTYAVLKAKIDKLSWWIKKGFGAGGLKAYVFEAMLKRLNDYCLNYYQQLKFRVEFSVDLSKASKPFKTLIYSGDTVRDYMDLSGGQKQRVDICIAFAMHDLITDGTEFNILALDEIFEGMDTEGIETAFELIRMKAEKRSVYLVTHNDIIDSMNCKTIEIGSIDGATYIKN